LSVPKIITLPCLEITTNFESIYVREPSSSYIYLYSLPEAGQDYARREDFPRHEIIEVLNNTKGRNFGPVYLQHINNLYANWSLPIYNLEEGSP
jgi:hypothetical protein